MKKDQWYLFTIYSTWESFSVYVVNVTFSVNHFKMAKGHRSSNPIPNAWNQIPILMMGMGCQAMLMAMIITTKTCNLCLFCILVPSNLSRTRGLMSGHGFFSSNLKIAQLILLVWRCRTCIAGADVIVFEKTKYRKFVLRDVHHFISFY